MDKDFVYCFLAHKPESSDYCRGCCMARYPGEMVSLRHVRKEAVINELRLILYKNLHLECNEAGYEIIGILMTVNTYDWDEQDEWPPHDYWWLETDSYMYEAFMDAANEGVRERIAREAKEAGEKSQVAATLSKVEQDRKDAVEFERLKKKFGNAL